VKYFVLVKKETPFVGVNHHANTFLFGCALLSNEEMESTI
jgi:hypothetical protein